MNGITKKWTGSTSPFLHFALTQEEKRILGLKIENLELSRFNPVILFKYLLSNYVTKCVLTSYSTLIF